MCRALARLKMLSRVLTDSSSARGGSAKGLRRPSQDEAYLGMGLMNGWTLGAVFRKK